MAVVNWFFISASMTCKDKFIMVYVRYTAYSFLFKWHILSKLYAPQAVGGVAQMILKIPHPPCSKPNSTIIWRRKVECRKTYCLGSSACVEWTVHYGPSPATSWEGMVPRWRDADPMLVYYRSTACDAGPTVNQHWMNVSCVCRVDIRCKSRS